MVGENYEIPRYAMNDINRCHNGLKYQGVEWLKLIDSSKIGGSLKASRHGLALID